MASAENAPIGQDKARLVLDHANAVAILTLSGEWTVQHLSQKDPLSFGTIPKAFTHLIINGSNLEAIDTSGAWLILQGIRSYHFTPDSIEWIGFSDSQVKILKMIAAVKHEKLRSRSHGPLFHFIRDMGGFCVGTVQGGITLTSFFGQLCLTVKRVLRHPGRLRFKSVVYHINDIGIKAMPIVIMMAFFISLVLGYQGANQLKLFGAKEYTVNLVAISLLREMGVLITAIMLSGRSCSAFAAQIGVMQMNDEVAALRTLGLDPFELLVLPRVIAVVIALPILTFVADIAGLAGTYFIASSYLGLSYPQFADHVLHAANEMTFYIGLMKAPVFGFFIGLIGCYQGLQVRTSATELGFRTTAAVVQSIFWIVLMDAFFSVIFTWMNI